MNIRKSDRPGGIMYHYHIDDFFKKGKSVVMTESVFVPNSLVDHCHEYLEIAYIKDGKVVTWTQTDWVLKEAPAMAIEAYNKAYEIDPKSAAKAKDGLQQISDFCSQVGNTGIDTGEYVAAADAYATAFQAQSSPAYGVAADPALLYYAGYLRTVDGSAHPSSFGQGAEYLKKAIDLGVSKINVNTECQLAFADATRKYIEAGKDLEGKGFDPRKLLAPGAEAIKATVKEKMELFGSVGKAE